MKPDKKDIKQLANLFKFYSINRLKTLFKDKKIVKLGSKLFLYKLNLNINESVPIKILPDQILIKEKSITPEDLLLKYYSRDIKKMEVAYEDDTIYVLNKPALVHSEFNDLEDEDTVIRHIFHKWGLKFLKKYDNDKDFYRHFGLIQRLDYKTSGLIIGAKSFKAFRAFKTMQERDEIKKEYLTLVLGKLDSQKIISTGFKSKGPKVKVADISEDIKPYETIANVIEPYDKYTYLRVFITKGYRHQIRAHLAHVGLPICFQGLRPPFSPILLLSL